MIKNDEIRTIDTVPYTGEVRLVTRDGPYLFGDLYDPEGAARKLHIQWLGEAAGAALGSPQSHPGSGDSAFQAEAAVAGGGMVANESGGGDNGEYVVPADVLAAIAAADAAEAAAIAAQMEAPSDEAIAAMLAADLRRMDGQRRWLYLLNFFFFFCCNCYGMISA